MAHRNLDLRCCSMTDCSADSCHENSYRPKSMNTTPTMAYQCLPLINIGGGGMDAQQWSETDHQSTSWHVGSEPECPAGRPTARATVAGH